MNGIIKVSAPKLQATAGRLQNYASQLANLAEELSNKAHQLASWEGDASNAYIRKIYAERQDVIDCMIMVRKRAQELIIMAQNYTVAERQNTADASALKVDVVQA